MARKTLLNEQEIRKFLKLANITTVGDNKIQEMGGTYYNRDEEEPMEEEEEEELGMGPEEEEGLEDDASVELDAAEPMGDDDMGEMDAGAEDEMTLSDEEAEAIIALADKLRAAMEEPDGDMGDVGDMPEAEPEGGDDLEMAAVDDEPMMEEEELEESNEEDLVAEVARRVAARLQADNKREQVVDALAERIMNRLTK